MSDGPAQLFLSNTHRIMTQAEKCLHGAFCAVHLWVNCSDELSSGSFEGFFSNGKLMHFHLMSNMKQHF